MRVPLTTQRARPLEATLLARPHRFAVTCRLASGETVQAHLPDPGRLTGTAVPGAAVWLDGPFALGRRKLPWTCVAMRAGSTWVGTHSALANRALPVLLAAGLLPELGRPERLRREVRRGRSRFDWVLESAGTERWVEVKSVTLAAGDRARFPDAVTRRGARHLTELTEMARDGLQTAVVFVAQRGDVHRFEAAAEIDPALASALGAAQEAGVRILAAAMEVSEAGLLPLRRLTLCL
ncbi:MAG: DNA/RNA nuclease SfsA [Deltaproteobacteria bacterium]|nr:MAG: DNA/RNA nuclease SfsA [Deltaproteobacteria bacterium]